MPSFTVKWTVIEQVNGSGQHDEGVRDGDRRTLADGVVEKEAESEDALRAALTAVLEQTYPPHALGPTYDLDRWYEIEITPVGEIDT